MGEPKPIASLSSSLLARKGHARPAMRPQGFAGFGAVPQSAEDLGWNDMGHDAHAAPVPAPAPEPQPMPPVLKQREKLAEDIVAPMVEAQPEVVEPAPEIATPVAVPQEPAEPASLASIAPKPRRVADATVARIDADARAKTGRAAFTLRLAPERHLRLRLACAVRHTSAQLLVTEALDRLLDSLPEVEELARRLPSHGKH